MRRQETAVVSVWLPYLANVIGARPPFHVPEWPHRRRPTGRAHDDEYQRIFQLESETHSRLETYLFELAGGVLRISPT